MIRMGIFEKSNDYRTALIHFRRYDLKKNNSGKKFHSATKQGLALTI